MNLIRFCARAFLSSYFVVQGVQRLKNPQDSTAELQDCLDTFRPTAEKLLPAEFSSRLPEDAADLVKAQSLAQIAAGAVFAVNFLRRPAAVTLALTQLPRLLASMPKRGQKLNVGELTTSLALFGATLLAAADTEGKPSLLWQARSGVHVVQREVADKKAKAVKLSRKAREQAAEVFEG